MDNFSINTRVSQFEILGSTVFTEQELNSIVQGYENSFLSKQELVMLIQSINDLYANKDYIGSGVSNISYLESDETIKMQIVEGSIEEINIVGLKRIKPNYVKNRLQFDTPLHKTELIEALDLLKISNLIENISARLVEGSGLGKYSLEVELKEAKAFYT